MKEKTKKILAGIGLGICSAFTLTACTSDITFNQSDLDNVINGANQYLETQNNYSSEFARNMLNDFLIKSLFESKNTTSGIIKTTYEETDLFGNVIYSNIETQRFYTNTTTNTTKQSIMYEVDHGYDDYKGSGYREIVFDETKEEHYSIKSYDLVAKEYTETETDTLDNDVELSQTKGYGSIGTAYMNSLSTAINYFLTLYNEGNVIMDTIAENDYIFRSVYIDGVDSPTVVCTIRIKDGLMISGEMSVQATYDQDIITSYKIELEWNTADFTVDTSDCVLVTE